MSQCIAYCLAKNFQHEALIEYLEQRYRVVKYRDVCHVEKPNGEAFIFPYGVVVFWDLPHDEAQTLLAEIDNFCKSAHATPYVDEFNFSGYDQQFKVHTDHIHLTSDDVKEKLAISHGIAQSVKLSELEDTVGNTIEATAHIPQRIADQGKSELSRRQTSRIRGDLFLVKSNIYLNYDLLDTPEFFWEYPEFQGIYNTMINYLEVNQRIEVLNKKLNIIHELFTMLSDEQKHQHSSTLEWIIIWLIAIEIVMFLVHDIFEWV